MLTIILQFLTFLYVTIKRIIASFILSKILGWKITKNYNSYSQYRKGRHVWIFAHTSIYDGIIGYLAYIAYDIPVVGVAKKELSQIPVLGYFMKKMNVIFIDRIHNTNTAAYISNELEKKKNFVFTISPEGTRHLVKDIRSGFYYVAVSTKADLHMIKLNYEHQTISVEQIVSNDTIKTESYDTIKALIIDEMKKEIPYHPNDFHLMTKKNINTSIININNSWLKNLPLMIVLYILFSMFF